MKNLSRCIQVMVLAVLLTAFVGTSLSYSQLFKEDGVTPFLSEDSGKQLSLERSHKKLQEVLKNVQIMSRIFNDLLAKELGDDFKSRGYFYDGCRGLWIPGEGALFMVSVDFSVHYLNGEEKKESDDAIKKDLWERYERDVSVKNDRTIESNMGENSPPSSHLVPSYAVAYKSIEKLKVEKLKETILDAIAKYGHRIKGLQDNQKIIVIVNGTEMKFTGYTRKRLQELYQGINSPYGSSDAVYGGIPDYPAILENGIGSSTMIFQIPVRDLPSESGNAEDIQQKVLITSYAVNSASTLGRLLQEPPVSSSNSAPAQSRGSSR